MQDLGGVVSLSTRADILRLPGARRSGAYTETPVAIAYLLMGQQLWRRAQDMGREAKWSTRAPHIEAHQQLATQAGASGGGICPRGGTTPPWPAPWPAAQLSGPRGTRCWPLTPIHPGRRQQWSCRFAHAGASGYAWRLPSRRETPACPCRLRVVELGEGCAGLRNRRI